MSGYTPVFRSVFEGSLCGQYPDTAAWLFILALADKNGNVDKTPQYISAVTGMPVDVLLGCIERFMQPDPMSRTPDDDGRRLAPIDPARGWGWSVINHGKYREKARKAASDAERVSDGRNAERMRARREDPTRPAVTRADPPSDTDTDTNKREGSQPPAAPPKRGSRLPEDWTPDMDAISVPADFSVEGEAAKFRDYWVAVAGAKGVKADWPATWRNWVRRAVQGGSYAKRSGGITWR